MGSDVWTDEMRCFYFAIAPSDFHQLLAGRDWQSYALESPQETKTIHISPASALSGRSYYEWKTDGAMCRVFPEDSHEHVIVIFSAD